MRKIVLVTLALLFVTLTYAQRKIKSNGNVVTIERNTGDYEGLQVSGFYEVELVDGTEGKITLTGEDNILEHIETEVRGETLTIKSKDNKQLKVSQGEKVFITIPVEKIDVIRLSGSGKVTGKKTFEATSFKVQTSGSRNADLTLDAKSVTIVSSGSSNITLGGTTERIDITSSGSSNLNAFELSADKVDIKSSGSSNIRITVNEAIDSKVSGSGNIRYRGNPSKIHNNTSGSGKVSKD